MLWHCAGPLQTWIQPSTNFGVYQGVLERILRRHQDTTRAHYVAVYRSSYSFFGEPYLCYIVSLDGFH